MAITPLFVLDMNTLKARLRLSGVKDAADKLIDECTEVVRGNFFRALGAARIDVLLATAYTENATTDADVLRTVANTTEVLWVRCCLMRRLPSFAIDGGGDGLARWNDDAAFRRESEFGRNAELARCEAELGQNLDILRGDEKFGEEKSIQSHTFEPTGCEQPRPQHMNFGVFGPRYSG